MLFDEFVNSAIVVDNVESELKPLVGLLRKKDIRVDSFLYGKNRIKTFHRNRQLIFIDMILNEDSRMDAENMSMVIDTLHKLCADDFGLYGLVVWTKHPEKIGDLKARISKAAFTKENATGTNADDEEETTQVKIIPPLFILALNKNKYIKAGYDYSSLPQDLDVALKKDKSACFFVKWSMSVMLAKDDAVKGIYNMVDNYCEQSARIPFLLYKLALNHTGAPSCHSNITVDAYKAFDELLYSELAIQQKNVVAPQFSKVTSNPFGEDAGVLQTISAKLNERICIDSSSLPTKVVVPGNVYLLKDTKSPLKIDIGDGFCKNILEKVDVKTIKYVAIELTPPCDFSQLKKIYSRLVGGIVFDIPLGINSKKKKLNFKIDHKELGDKTYALYPITIGDDKVRCIFFDFRYLQTISEIKLKNAKKFELWFRAKPKFFADVLQKFSSHAARLGLSNIDLAKQLEKK